MMRTSRRTKSRRWTWIAAAATVLGGAIATVTRIRSSRRRRTDETTTAAEPATLSSVPTATASGTGAVA